jgi:GTP-binding protein
MSQPHDCEPNRSCDRKRINGVMIASETGAATAFSLLNMAERGVMFIQPADPIYAGQIVGEHNRDNDLNVNVVKAKHLTNMRVAFKEQTVVLKTPRLFTLEAALEYIEDNELVEITPKYSAMIREIAHRGRKSRFKKTERGLFAVTGK